MPPADPFDPPVLAWVSAAAPGLWFPADVPEPARAAARDGVWALCRRGLVEVADWVPGRGQGFRLAGEPPTPAAAPEPTDAEKVARPLLDPRPAVVTPLLLIVHVGWFVVGGLIAARTRAVTDYLAGTNHPLIHPILVKAGAVSGRELLAGGWWRLITCEFVHVGLFHLFGNMMILGLLGGLAEAVWGRWRFLLIYLLAGLAAGATVMTYTPVNAGGEVVYGSASGGLWGVSVAVLAWLARNLKDAPPEAAADCVRRVVVVAVMNVIVSFAQGVSLAGLVGGSAGGLVAAWALARLHDDRPAAVAWLVGGVMAFAGMLAAAMAFTADWQAVRERVGL